EVMRSDRARSSACAAAGDRKHPTGHVRLRAIYAVHRHEEIWTDQTCSTPSLRTAAWSCHLGIHYGERTNDFIERRVHYLQSPLSASRRRMRCIQCLKLLRCQCQRDSVLLYMRCGTRFGDCNDVTAADGPGERNSGCRATVYCANTSKCGGTQQIGAGPPSGE